MPVACSLVYYLYDRTGWGAGSGHISEQYWPIAYALFDFYSRSYVVANVPVGSYLSCPHTGTQALH